MKPIFYSLGIVLLVLFAVALRPVPRVAAEECLTTSGIVIDIYEGGTHDVNLKLKDNDEWFYINRGTELGLNVEALRTEILGHEVELTYPKHWTPLDPFDKTHHLTKVRTGDRVVFSKFN